MTRIALVQMSSQNDLSWNLSRMRERLKEAVKGKGATHVVFPEMAYFMGSAREWVKLLGRYEELLHLFSTWAKEQGSWLLPGTLREPVPGEPARYFNTLPVFDPQGNLVAHYRKLHLFRASLPDRNYEEGRECVPGEQLVTCDCGPMKWGLSICFDLRFPELFRALKKRGAQVICLPSAFTVPTGQAHWEVLVRARAIENQSFVIAPAQTGRVGEGREAYGHSLAVSPWGSVLLDLGTQEGVGVVDIDGQLLSECAAKIGAWPPPQAERLPIP